MRPAPKRAVAAYTPASAPPQKSSRTSQRKNARPRRSSLLRLSPWEMSLLGIPQSNADAEKIQNPCWRRSLPAGSTVSRLRSASPAPRSAPISDGGPARAKTGASRLANAAGAAPEAEARCTSYGDGDVVDKEPARPASGQQQSASIGRQRPSTCKADYFITRNVIYLHCSREPQSSFDT